MGEVEEVSDVLYPTNIDTLKIIPAGKYDHRTTELLASQRMHDTVDEFANRYKDRVVIIDTPPLIGITESAVLANFAGQAVVVVEEGRSKLNDIKFSSDKVLNDKFIVTTVENISLMLPLEGLIDVNEEKNRLNKELTNINLEIEIINKRLNNPMFIEKAPSNVINEVKTKQSIYTQRKFEIEKALLNI